jgi:hypothetical protein
MLSTVFGPERDEVTRDWKKKFSEKRHNLPYPSSAIITDIKSKRIT